MSYALSTSITTRAITQTGTDAAQATAMNTLISSVAATARITAVTSGAYRKAAVETSATVGFWYQCTTAGTTGDTEPTWPVSITGVNASAWATRTSYALNARLVPTVGGNVLHNYRCSTAGTSCETQPAWPGTVGNTVTDNTAPNWAASETLAVGARRKPTVGGLTSLNYRVSAITTGITGGTQPTWPTVNAGTVVDGGVTWTAETAAVWTVELASNVIDNGAAVWTSGATLAVGARRRPTVDTSLTGKLNYRVSAITTGITAGTEPVWPTAAAGTVVDGGVTWTAETAPIWAAVTRPSVINVGTSGSSRKFVYFGGFQFAVQGTATIDDRQEEVLVGDAVGPAIGVNITGSGNLKCGVAQTQINGLDWYTRNTALTMICASSVYGIEVSGASARLELRGATIAFSTTTNSSVYVRIFSSGTFYCREGALVAYDFSKDVRLRHEAPATMDVIGLRCVGVWINQSDAWTNAQGIVIENESGPELNLSSTTPAANSSMDWYGYDARKTTSGYYTQKNFVMHTSPYVKFFDPYLGTNMDHNVPANASGKQGVAEVIKRVNITVTDIAGTAVTDAAFFCRDTDNGGRVNLTPKSYSSSINYVSDRTYYAVPNGSGVIPTQNILLGVAHTSTNTWSRRTKGGNAYSGDLMDFHVWSYGYLYTGLPNVSCVGSTDPLTYGLKLVADTTVSDTKTNVAAYTACESLDKVRDYCKWMKTQQATMEQPTISTELVTPSGTNLSFGSYNVVVDALASVPVSFAGNTITIEATTLVEGTKYKTFSTTGTVTFANGATTTALYSDSSGARGRLTLTDLPAGSDIIITQAGTTTVVHSVDQNAGTTYSWTFVGAQSVDVGVINPGYIPKYVRNVALTTVASSLPMTMQVDRNYMA